jgi:hypothetical protein
MVGGRTGRSWMTNSGIIKLNFMLAIFQISSYATGYDGSMMNGLQSLTTWQNSFNNPVASELGLYVNFRLDCMTPLVDMNKNGREEL